MDTLPTTSEVLAAMRRLRGSACRACGRDLLPHEIIMSLAMGYENAPRCCGCLATAFERERKAFRDYVHAYIMVRDCYREAWLSASRESGFEDEMRPPTLWDRAEGVVPARAGAWRHARRPGRKKTRRTRCRRRASVADEVETVDTSEAGVEPPRGVLRSGGSPRSPSDLLTSNYLITNRVST